MELETSTSQRSNRRSSERQESSDRRFWHPTPGKIVNACNTGMAVQTRIKLEVGRTYTFRARYQSMALQIPGTVKWSRLEISKRPDSGQLAYYSSGLFFPDSLEQAAAAFLLGKKRVGKLH